jgi:hypothetical protein
MTPEELAYLKRVTYEYCEIKRILEEIKKSIDRFTNIRDNQYEEEKIRRRERAY